jgi:RNA polymerase sigma-70 factor (ECF subfamily)
VARQEEGWSLGCGWIGTIDGGAAAAASPILLAHGRLGFRGTLLDWVDDRIVAIRDFRYAPYVVESLTVQRLVT